MASAEMTAASGRLLELAGRLQLAEGFAEVVESLLAGHAATLDGVWGSSCALAAAALASRAPAALVVVCPLVEQVDDFIDDLSLFSRLSVEEFPPQEADDSPIQDETYGRRLRLLKLLDAKQSPPKLIVAAVQSLMQPVPDPETLRRRTRRLHVGDTVEIEALARWLVEGSLTATPAVDLPGEFAVRGGLMDVFAADWDGPVRLEFFGDRIESIRRFDIGSQRKVAELEEVELTIIGSDAAQRAQLADYLSPASWFLLLEPAELEQQGRQFFERMGLPAIEERGEAVSGPLSLWERARVRAGTGTKHNFSLPQEGPGVRAEGDSLSGQYSSKSHGPHPNPLPKGEGTEQKGEGRGEKGEGTKVGLHTVSSVLRRAFQFPSATAAAVAAASMETTCRLRIESVEQFSGEIGRVRDELDEAAAGQHVFLVCQTEAEVRRLGDIFAATKVAQEGRLFFPLGSLKHGFRLVDERIVLVGSGELFRREDLRRPSRRRLLRAIDSFLELREGELVVHVGHGVARYRGMKLLEKAGQIEEHLELEFQGQTKLYVPATKIGLVQKYVGGSKSRPKLAKLGGRLWGRQKERVEEAVTDLAADMLDLQAARASRPGIAFPPDTEWQREFDASFPYTETVDQMAAIEAIKRDMCQSRPMDRLMCGEVGYGKTEVAMRAAFKAVEAGYQVAVLVPTTLLCEQHQRTFAARMAEFPFQIATLSRFATRRQQAEIIERLATGSLDVVIGTHRLVQPDVQFHNLGLVVIDEEQRFGVEVKERLKALRHSVDVLTMTATPIPRTLHLGLLGLRDISNLETPPEDRLAVETRINRFDPELIRQAVLRELNRGGQVFFVHNRVEGIENVARRLRQIVPEARLSIGHGQMAEHELERVMLDFLDRRTNMLLATTIIESGLDIPTANTIFIDEADRYGLADLHQLRGRVGRYKHRAYCYLLIDPNKNLSPSAVKRLRAIEEYSRLGAGFAIAMRDLEIRGAGNILGAEQSGHIAAVGYELYCELLDQAVRRRQNLPPRSSIEVDVDLPGEGHIPRSYVPDMRQKIDLYRRLARVVEAVDLDDLKAELTDRFGPPPPPVRHLLELAELRIAAHGWSISSIHLEDQYVVLSYSSAPRIHRLANLSRGRLRVVDERSAYLPLVKEVTTSEKLLFELKSLLRPS